jgi:hypothetical protein
MSEQQIESQELEVADDELATLPAERLAAMLRDKRKAEATVRGKLRDAEAQRDALAGTVSGFQKEALTGVAKTAGVLPSALADLALHVPLESVLGEGGLLDAEKATAALTELKVSKPHFFPAMAGASGANFGGGSGERYSAGGASWGDVLK